MDVVRCLLAIEDPKPMNPKRHYSRAPLAVQEHHAKIFHCAFQYRGYDARHFGPGRRFGMGAMVRLGINTGLELKLGMGKGNGTGAWHGCSYCRHEFLELRRQNEHNILKSMI